MLSSLGQNFPKCIPKRWYTEVRDSKYDSDTSPPQDAILFSHQEDSRMLNSEILDAYNQMTEDPQKIPFATIIAVMWDTLDREIFNSIKMAFDKYIKTLEYNKYNEKLVLSVYQAQILGNSEIIDMIEIWYEIIKQDGPVGHKEVLKILESFSELIFSRSNDHYFLAECLELLDKIFIEL